MLSLHPGYSIASHLSAGRDGSRYSAIREHDGGEVELHVLNGLAPESDREDRLLRRLRLAQLIDHPAVVRVHQIHHETRPVSTVLDCLPNRSLGNGHDWLAKSSVSKRLETAQQISGAVAAAHQVGLVHGQIDADTIHIAPDETIRIDFTGTRTSPDAGIDDLSWSESAAPNVAESEPDRGSDVQQLARLVLWVLSADDGLVDATHETILERLKETLAGELDPDQIQALSDLLTQMIHNEPSERPSAKQLSGALGGAEAKEPKTRETLNETVDGDVVRLDDRHAEPPQAFMGGQRIGRFRLLGEIGRGGMGRVYRAEDLADHSPVALKVLSPTLVDRPDAAQRFLKEARLLGEVNNRNVVQLVEADEDDGVHYIAMEFIEGNDLRDFLVTNGSLEERLALGLTADVARGLVGAHELGIIHRDIKPNNILLLREPESEADQSESSDDHSASSGDRRQERRPEVKLTDFGLARHVDQSVSLELTQTDAVLGTPGYMAPEQCGGDGEVGPATDIYSLGITLFEMLTGRPPFVGNYAQLSKMHRTSQPPEITKLRPNVSDATVRLVNTMLAKNPTDRPLDAMHLLSELEALLRGETSDIRVHPILPEHDPQRVFRADFTWDLQSTPLALWPYVSNTERINCAVGVPSVEYRTERDLERGVRKFGAFQMAGLKIDWEEFPFEWIEGRRLGVLRHFSRGPFKWFLSTVELSELPEGGTRLDHSVRIEPNGLLGRMVAQLEVVIKGKPALDRVYRRIDDTVFARESEQGDRSKQGDRSIGGGSSVVSQGTTDPFLQPNKLPSAARRRLDERLDALAARRVDASMIERIGDYLATAPAQEVGRIRPVALARQMQLDPDEVISACLHAARAGLMEVHWDILCPTCRISSSIKNTLREIESHDRCDVCDLDFDIDFGNSVELIFRVHPEIREADLGTYCIGGPEHAPHVVAQIRLQPGERIELRTLLDEGEYRLRGPKLAYTIPVTVQRGRGSSHGELVLSDASATGNTPAVRLRAGGQVLAVTNDHGRELLIRLERTIRRQDVVTAAQASSMAIFRELFPSETLRPGQLVQLANATLLVAELSDLPQMMLDLGDAAAFELLETFRDTITQEIQHYGGAFVRQLDSGLLATFRTANDAVCAAMAIPEALAAMPASGRLQPRMAVHRGEALVTTVADQLDYFGINIAKALDLPRHAEPGELIVSDSVSSDPQVSQTILESGLDARILVVDDPPASGMLTQRITLI